MNMFNKVGAVSVSEYLDSLEEKQKQDITKIHRFILKHAPRLKPYMQDGMIGYGKRPYKTKSGREGEWFTLGLASRKNYLAIYSCVMEDGKYLAEKVKESLGEASVGKSCIRYKKIEDIPWDQLKKVIIRSETLSREQGIF